jgi:fibronectin-binding autotransporter adhesin
MLSNRSDICSFFLRINRRHALAKRQAVSRSLTIFMLASLLVSLGFQVGIVQAQSFTWTGAGADNNWSTAGNWQGGTSPTGSDTTELRFTDASLRGSVFQDISSPFVLRQLEIETVNGGFTMDSSPLDFRGNFGGSGVFWGGPQPIIVNQDWQVNSNLQSGSALTTGVGSGLLIHNGEIGGSGQFSLWSNSMVLNGNVSGLTEFTVSSGGDLQLNGTIDSSVGTVFLGNPSLNNQPSAHIRGSGIIDTRIQLAFGDNVISSDSTFTINGDIYTLGSSDINSNASQRTLRIGTGRVDVNGDIKNTYLVVDSLATLAGSGRLYFRNPGSNEINGRITSDKTIILDQQFTGSSIGGTVLKGNGIIDCNIEASGGFIEGNLTLNGTVLVKEGDYVQAFLGNEFGSSLAINGDVLFDANSTVFGEIRGAGQLVTMDGRSVQYSADIYEVSNVVRGTIRPFGVFFSDTSKISLEGGVLAVPGSQLNSVIDAMVTSVGVSEIEDLLSTATFNGNVIAESGTLNISGTVQGSGTLTIKSGASVTLQNPSSSIRLDVVNEGLFDGTTSKATIEADLFSRGGEYQGLFDCFGTMTVESGNQSVLRSGADGYVDRGTIVNNSALSIEAGAVLRGPGALIVNGGELLVNGEVRSNTVVNQSSILLGSGLFVGDLSVNGRLGPGNSAGTIGVDGSLTLGETSVVTVEIGGSTPGLYDAIDGRGLSVLNIQGGELDLVFLNNFTPDSLEDFDIFQNFAEINGRFGGGSGGNNNFNAGDRYYFNKGSFAIEYGNSFIRLSDFQAVPEPSGTVLLGCIALGLTTFRRRRELAV